MRVVCFLHVVSNIELPVCSHTNAPNHRWKRNGFLPMLQHPREQAAHPDPQLDFGLDQIPIRGLHLTSETENASARVWMRNVVELVIGDMCSQLIIVCRPILLWEPDHEVDFAAAGVACCIPGLVSDIDTLCLATSD